MTFLNWHSPASELNLSEASTMRVLAITVIISAAKSSWRTAVAGLSMELFDAENGLLVSVVAFNGPAAEIEFDDLFFGELVLYKSKLVSRTETVHRDFPA